MDPVDELAELRRTMRRLRARAEELRLQILNREVSRVGEQYIARVTRHVTTHELSDPEDEN